MSRSSADRCRTYSPDAGRCRGRRRARSRAQVEPLVALVSVAAVCLGLALYAGVLDGALATVDDRATVETAASRALDAVAPTGVATPGRLGRALDAAPGGYRLNATLLSGDHRWSVGPTSPSGDRARTADRPTGVRLAPGDVRPGTLRVVLWR